MNAKTLREKLAGAEVVLQDEVAVERFRFHTGDDKVAATLGTRNGSVCAPLLRYLVTDDGKVQFSDHRAILFTWEQIELSDDILIATCAGNVKRFAIAPSKIKEGALEDLKRKLGLE